MAAFCGWIGHLLVHHSVMLEKLSASEQPGPAAAAELESRWAVAPWLSAALQRAWSDAAVAPHKVRQRTVARQARADDRRFRMPWPENASLCSTRRSPDLLAPTFSHQECTMNRSPFRPSTSLRCTALTAIFLLSGTVSAQTAPATPASGAMTMGKMQPGGSGSHDMKATMMMGMDGMQKMQPSGDVDKDFAMMMKLHHQQAVDMAEMQLAHGKSPAMKSMSRQIIAAQKKEIATFDAWLARQK